MYQGAEGRIRNGPNNSNDSKGLNHLWVSATHTVMADTPVS